MKSEISVFDDCLVFLTFLLTVFPCIINYVIKARYILLELKVPWPMSAISETYKRAHKILGLEDILPNASVTLIKQEMIITNKNDNKKNEMTD